MYVYLMTIPDSIKGISDKLNIKALLCNKSWIVFNEEGKKIVFIFQKRGDMIISKNGVVTKGKWEYINKSLILEGEDTSLLLHPTFENDMLFILQQDGTDYHIILINESRCDELKMRTLEAINNYLDSTSKKSDPEYQLQQQRKAEMERAIKAKQEELWEIKAREAAKEELEQRTKPIRRKRNFVLGLWVMLFIASIIVSVILAENGEEWRVKLSVVNIILLFTAPCLIMGFGATIEYLEDEIIEKHKKGIRLSSEEIKTFKLDLEAEPESESESESE